MHTLTAAQGEVGEETLRNMQANVDDMRLVLTLAKMLAKVEARTLGKTLSNFKGKALDKTLREAEAATSANTLGYLEMRKWPIS